MLLTLEIDQDEWKECYSVENVPEDVTAHLNGNRDGVLEHLSMLFANDNGAKVIGFELAWKTVTVNFCATVKWVDIPPEEIDENVDEDGYPAFFCDACGAELDSVYHPSDMKTQGQRIAGHYTQEHDGRGNFELAQ
jgi:hypothetical protein